MSGYALSILEQRRKLSQALTVSNMNVRQLAEDVLSFRGRSSEMQSIPMGFMESKTTSEAAPIAMLEDPIAKAVFERAEWYYRNTLEQL